MKSNTSQEAFLSAILERFDVFKSDVDNFLDMLVSGSLEAKRQAGSELLRSANDLKRLLIADDQPDWLNSTISTLNSNVGNLEQKTHSTRLIRSIAGMYRRYQDHRWQFMKEATSGIDFDSIYEACRDSGRLPELFDALVSILEQLVESGEVDSVRAVTALKKVADTLKRNRKGSFFAMFGSMESVVDLAGGWILTELEKVPVLGGLVTELREKLGETEKEFEDLNIKIQTEVRKQLQSEFKVLEYKPRSLGVSQNEKLSD